MSDTPDRYDPPQVDDVPAEDGPAVTAADASPLAAEWRPVEHAGDDTDQAGPGT